MAFERAPALAFAALAGLLAIGIGMKKCNEIHL